MEWPNLPCETGTYALVLVSMTAGPLRVGKLGTMHLKPGVYVYIGSAFGSGGLAARIRHHTQIAARPHWHIDYLRAACPLIGVWYTADPARREHDWAAAVARMAGAVIPTPGFGSSDCDCAAHLCWFDRQPTEAVFRRALRAADSSGRWVKAHWAASNQR